VPDGLIYFRIRDYQGHLGREPDQDAEADAWATLLAQSGRRKPDYLKRFLEHKSFPPAFDRLLPIPGLTADFSIGNLQRLMNLHCDEVSGMPHQTSLADEPAAIAVCTGADPIGLGRCLAGSGQGAVVIGGRPDRAEITVAGAGHLR
jgi:hypothetical protein